MVFGRTQFIPVRDCGLVGDSGSEYTVEAETRAVFRVLVRDSLDVAEFRFSLRREQIDKLNVRKPARTRTNTLSKTEVRIMRYHERVCQHHCPPYIQEPENRTFKPIPFPWPELLQKSKYKLMKPTVAAFHIA